MGLVNLISGAMTHPLGSRQRLQTLSRIAGWQIQSRLRREVSRKWVNGARLVAARGEAGATGNFYFGLMEPYDMGFLAHFLRRGDLFVDGGANVGAYTVLASAVGARVHAFEPAAESLARLRQNIAVNEAAATVHAAALADFEGEAHFAAGRGAENSLDPDGPAIVPVSTLDVLALDPAAVKLDLEGGEEAALRGARMTLARPNLLALLVESVTAASRELLASSGFARRWYDPFERTLSSEPRGSPANELWLRSESEVAARVRSAPPLIYAGKDLFGRC